MFYGPGWIVTYDKEGRWCLWHAGIFTSGAATIVRLIPSEHFGIVVLTNGITFPIGADGKATTVVVEELNLPGDGILKRQSVENK
jgi:hypothetical protein